MNSKRAILNVFLMGVLAVGLMPATALAVTAPDVQADTPSSITAQAPLGGVVAASAAAGSVTNADACTASADAPADPASTSAAGDGITALAMNPLGSRISREDALNALAQFEAAYPSFEVVYEPGAANKPSTVAPYNAGKLAQSAIDPALGCVNLIRYYAGLSHDIAITDANNELAQAAAVVNAANGELSHTPTRPAGMNDALYNSGFQGASSSNLNAGIPELALAVTLGWLADAGDNNKADLGHRRWILYPNLTTTGFGFAETTQTYRYFSAMLVPSESYAGDTGTYVAWPAQTTPTELALTTDSEKGYPWSFSLGRPIANPDSVTVTLTRTHDGATWRFGKVGGAEDNDGELYVSNQTYGDRGCIIFTPDNSKEKVYPYKDGDQFRVHIEGATDEPIEYTVDFVSNHRDIGKAQATEKGEPYKFTGKPITPEITFEYNGEPLVEGIDFEYKLENNVTPGTARGTAVGLGVYKGSEYDFTFEIYGDTYGFPDVKPGSWYAIDDVLGYTQEREIMSGYGNGNFGPHDRITRAQAAVVLHNLAGNPKATSKPFKDVNYSRYYGPAISWARAVGITNGYGNTNTFGPNDYITREQFAAMMTTYASKIGKVDITPVGEKAKAMSDYDTISNFAKPSVEWVMDHEILTGYALVDGGLAVNPSGYTERCQAAKMLAMLHRDVLNGVE